MTFNEYVKRCNGVFCYVWVRGCAEYIPDNGGRWCLAGIVEAHEDFILVHLDESGSAICVRYEDILMAEPQGEEEEEEEREELSIFDVFEQEYKKKKGEMN